MNKYIYILLLIIFVFKAYSYADSNDIKKIEMEVFRNGEVIGYSNYFFDQKDNIIIIKNNTKFKVELFGVSVFAISSETVETYENDELIYFKSKTFQNDKEKYVNLKYDQSLKKLIVDGSSYKGEANTDCIIGNWWNYKILYANCQISPLSGSIKDQVVTFLGKENISLYGRNYLVHHFKLKSKDENLPDNKKLDFDIWFNSENNLILKVAYSKMGNWEYRIKNIE